MLIPVIVVGALFVGVGFRLFRTALAATGSAGWLGGCFLCVGLAMPMRVLVTTELRLADDAETMLAMGSHGLMALGLSMYTLFVGRVFRPSEGWARLLTALLIGLEILAPLVIIFFGGHRDERHPVVLATGVVRALPFIWGFCESYAYYGRLRKRAALGLSDPVVTNRFALFAIWNGALFALPMILVLLRIWAAVSTESGGMLGDDATASLILGISRVVLLTLSGTVVAGVWLSFFPPAGWLDRLRRRAEATGT